MSFSNSYDTTNPGSAVSNREDLTDILKVLAPEETPIYSSLPHSKAKGTYHEWTMDTLSAPRTDGVLEGEDVMSFENKFDNRVRVGNYVQKLRRSYMVSDIQEAVDSVGPAKYAQAEKKAGLELKRDIEATLLSSNARVSGDSSNPGKLAALGTFIDSAGPSYIPADYRTPAGSVHASGAFTETVLNGLITSIYRQSGKSQSLNLHADTALRAVISGFARTSGATDAVYRQVMQSAGKKLTNTVGMYESDNGIVTIMNPVCAPDTVNKDSGFLLNMEFLGIADLIPMGTKGLQDMGGGKRGFVDWTGTLVVKHPGALGKITVLA
jgi:hypothetical protein